MKLFYKFAFVIFSIIVLNVSVNAQTHQANWESKIGGNLGILIPFGNLGDAVNTGFGFVGTYQYKVETDFNLTGSLGYYYFGGKAAGISVTSIPLLVGCQIEFKGKKVKPYVGADLGLYFSSAKSENGNSSGSRTQFGIAGKVGIEYPINKELNFDGHLKLNYIFDTPDNSFFLGLFVGVNYILD